MYLLNYTTSTSPIRITHSIFFFFFLLKKKIEWLTGSEQPIFKPEMDQNVLNLSRNAELRYKQTEIKSNRFFLNIHTRVLIPYHRTGKRAPPVKQKRYVYLNL